MAGPALEPVSLQEAKDHIRVDHADDDVVVLGLIATARRYVEDVTGRALITQSWRLNLSGWPSDVAGDWMRMVTQDSAGAIRIAKSPVQSVESVKYVDEDGTLVTLASNAYVLVQSDIVPTLVPSYQTTWPTCRLVPDAVRVEFTAGYGDQPESVPPTLRHAVLLLVGHYYANREATSQVPILQVPFAIDHLLSTYRMHLS